MGISSRTKGWRWDRTNDRLDFYYNGSRIGHIDAGGIDLVSAKTFAVNGTDVAAGTLDASYDLGKTITVDSTPVVLAGSSSANHVLSITKAGSTGNCIDFTNSGTGKDIDGSGSTWTIDKLGVAKFDSLNTCGVIIFTADVLGTGNVMIGCDNTADLTMNAKTGSKVHLAVNDTDVVDVAATAITLAQATTITTGGLTCGGNVGITGTLTSSDALTVSAGTTSAISSTNINLSGIIGLSGATTVTGNLTVTGSCTWGSALTVGNAVTVDELKLDTDGTAPTAAHTRGELVYNSTNSILYISVPTGDTIDLQVNATTEMQIGASDTIINDGSGDRNFRVESNGMAHALYVDGGKDCVVIGNDTNISDVDYRLMVGNVAKTLATGESAAILYVAPTASTTEFSGGTHTYIATAYFAEPNITGAGATCTVASTVYINDAPTEASANYALYIASGAVNIVSGALTVAAGAVTIEGGAFLFNEAGANLDFRAESDNLAYALYIDGAKDCVVIGDNTDISDVDYRLMVGNVAKTLATNESAAILYVAPTASTTEAASVSTHGYIATAYFSEPNITEGTGDTTVAATVYIANAPTEAETDNDALFIASGDATMASGNLTLKSGGVTLTSGSLTFTAASDILIAADTAAALEISDATTKYYAINTQVTTATGITTHTFDISDYTLASANTAVVTGMSLAAHTLTYSGSTQVTTQVDTVVIGARTIAGSAVTVDEGNSLLLVAPAESGSITLTAASALRIVNAGGTPANQYGIFIEDLTVGATANVGIHIAGASQAAIYVAADPIQLADNVKIGFGTGTGIGAYDASIYYSNADLVIIPNDIGTGLVNIAGGIESSSAAEIIISVDNEAITVGSEGALRVPFRDTTDAAFTDAEGGNVDGCLGIQEDTDNGNLGTIEARVNGSWVSVAMAGIEIQGKTLGSRKNPSNKWHDNQIIGEGLVDETICFICGKKMKVEEPIVLYPNFARTDKNDGSSSLHCVFAHLKCAQ